MLKACFHFAKRCAYTSWILQRFDFITSRQLSSHRYPIYCRALSNHWIQDSYENLIRNAFTRVAQENQCRTLYDVGANVGIFSLDFLSWNPQGTAVAFEPNLSVFQCLEKTKNKNKLDHLKIYQLAVSDQEGTAILTFDPLSPAIGGLHPIKEGKFNHELNYNGISKKIEVPTTTLDNFMAAHKFIPDIIKIDAEGEELKILCKSIKLFAKRKPILLFECSHHHNEISSLLAKYNYKIFDINLNRSSIKGINFAI